MEDSTDPRVPGADPHLSDGGDGGGMPPPVEPDAQTDAATVGEGTSEGPAVVEGKEGSEEREEEVVDDGAGGGGEVVRPPLGPSAQGVTSGVGSSVGGAGDGRGSGGDGGIGRGVGGRGGGDAGGSRGGVGGGVGRGVGGRGGGASGRSGGRGGGARGGDRGGVEVGDWFRERAARASSQARVPVTQGSGRRRGDEPKGKGVASGEPAVARERAGITLQDYVEHSRQEDVLEQARENPGLMAVVMEEMRRIREEEAARAKAALAEEEEARAFAREFEEEEAAEEVLAREEEERVQGRVTVVQAARR